MRLHFCLAITLPLAGMLACGDDDGKKDSRFGDGSDDPDPSSSPLGVLLDTSVVLGDCELKRSEASGLNEWSCPAAQECFDLEALRAKGHTCANGICPVCALREIPSSKVKCDDPRRSPTLELGVPAAVVCQQ